LIILRGDEPGEETYHFMMVSMFTLESALKRDSKWDVPSSVMSSKDEAFDSITYVY
jgi:hypothetical protein